MLDHRMDANELSMRGDVDCRKPRLVHTSESSTHNGHISTINLSYQIVLQDHNYGAPLPSHNNESPLYAVQCKQEDSHSTSAVSHPQRGVKTLTPRPHAISPQSGKATNKPNGLSLAKRQRTASGNSNGVPSPAPSRRPQEAPKMITPPLVSSKVVSGFPGDLNSHLYASVDKVKEEPRANGLSGYLGGWYRGSGVERVRSDVRNSFNDDDSNDGSLDNSPHVESDHEGEETETAPECEDEEDDQDDLDLLGGSSGRDLTNHDESVTRCICKFGHDDGYMICCDRCSVWQHVDCMNLDRNNIPDEFLCELCQPRRVDRARARAIQYRKRQEFRLTTPPPSSNVGRAGPRERTKNDDYIDVEKTPKKFQRTYTNSKYSRTKGLDRNDKLQRPGKRAGQTKWKRREKQDDSAPRKRKVFRAKSSEVIDVGGPSSSAAESSPSRLHPSGELLLQWIDHYEEAVTNHYSPELRARVSAVRPNGFGGEILSPPSHTPAYRLASKAGGYKTLVAAHPIRCGSPVIECRGKYMLATQLRPYKSGDGSGLGGPSPSGLRPTPHIIYHHLLAGSADSTTPMVEMCVDGRSYGNEARFVWQSCQPNAEIKHKVEKGTVHLYLVARTEILENEEITVAHDVKNPLPCPYEGCPHMKKDSGARTGLAPVLNTPLAVTNSSALSPVEGDRKRRRRRTNSTAAEVSSNITTPAIQPAETVPLVQPVAAVPSTPPAPTALPPTPVKRQQRTPSKISTVLTEGEDSQDGSQADEPETSLDSESNKRKLSREERKMEAIMKAFERMEKAQQRRQESVAKGRKDSKDDNDEVDHSPPPSHSSEKRLLSSFGQQDSKKPFRRGKRGGRTRRASSGAGESSRIRMRALSGEVNSGHSATEEESEHGGSSSPGQATPGTPVDDSMASFKCPKTKKVVFNNWSEGSEMNGNNKMDDAGSNSLSLPVCYMRNPNPRSPTRPFRTAHLRYGASPAPDNKAPYNMLFNGCRPSTLASLKSPTGSASPDPHGEHSNDENAWATPLPGSGGAGGSAKKRWLRQAISEETETEPAVANPPMEVLDHVTPLKKRRLARASLSSETSFTPPSTPTPSSVGMVAPSDSVEKDESLSGDNSQGNTPPECDELVEQQQRAPTPPLPQTLELAKAIASFSSAPNGFMAEVGGPWEPKTEVAFASTDEHVIAAAALTQFREDSICFDSTRPTWEFRAPDAQFMRCRNPNDVPDTATVDVAQQEVKEEKPQPIKRKLSILEYRQRKQIAPVDGKESTKEDSSDRVGSCATTAIESQSSDSDPTRTKDLSVESSHSTSESAADDSNTNSSYEGDEETSAPL